MKILFLLCLFWTGLIEAQTKFLVKGGEDFSPFLSEYLSSTHFQDIADSSSSVRIIVYRDTHNQKGRPFIVVLIENEHLPPAG